MSKWGRAQDALTDILWGYEDGEREWCPGPLYERMSIEEFGELKERIIRALFTIADPSAPATAPITREVGDEQQREAAAQAWGDVGPGGGRGHERAGDAGRDGA